ncbi:carbohydrate ABC transporter permease [Alicyclobacillus shizuokensis]|uniref:carbohydrate ABC transporter permease n=1 Tax=Alicyclobacillus shizuokensis TaxID=392014 RepID=UPI0009FAA1E5|nr:sugar ABC transporter permease [Alicyclobacillus shizuokensis]
MSLKARTRNGQSSMAGYLFLTPWLVGLLGLTALPMIASLYLSFTNYDMINRPRWIGIGNYVKMFQDPQYLMSVKVTLTYVLLNVPIHLVVALLIALLLHKGIRGLHIYRAVYYVPSLFGGSVAISLLWKQIFGGGGLVSNLLEHLFGLQNVNLIDSPQTALYTLIILAIWQFGSPMIIFLAGLQQIPVELHEAATIDGASTSKRFFRITLPLLTPFIFFNLVMQIISSFQAFTPAYIVSDGSGGPLNSTLFYTLYLYQTGFSNFQMGYASAMAWVLLIAIAIISAFLFATSKKWVFYSE